MFEYSPLAAYDTRFFYSAVDILLGWAQKHINVVYPGAGLSMRLSFTKAQLLLKARDDGNANLVPFQV